MAENLTIGQISELFGLPAWKVRRAVDALKIEIPRAGNYRIVARNLLGKIAAELERRGWQPKIKSASAMPLVTETQQ